MQIDLIETFLDLCETRSFNRTAERLGVTQSTVSGRIGALERVLQRRLFTRSRSGTALTTEGLSFEPHARNLRVNWAEALRAARIAGASAMTLRVGIQQDLAGTHIGEWVRGVRAALPEVALYIEADFSTQMCSDLVSGQLDLAMIFSPAPQPDLYFESFSEISYRMVSSEVEQIEEVRRERYILSNYSTAFSATHAALHPRLHSVAISSGQNSVVAGLLSALGGTAYVLEETAAELIRAGGFRMVRDAPSIPQPVYASVHLRNRHRSIHRRLIHLLRTHFVRNA